MRLVVALGGTTALEPGDPPEPFHCHADVTTAADALAPVAAAGHAVVVSHGHGPQTALLERELANRLPGRDVATVVTRAVVDGDDLPFAVPAKAVGPVYAERDVHWLAASRGWTVAPRDGGWRRIVPAPEPTAIVELATIRRLIEAGTLVVADGGAAPVAFDEHGDLASVEAIVDNDLTAALLAGTLGADALILLTDLPAVAVDAGTRYERLLATVTPAQLRSIPLAAAPIASRIEAACRFVDGTGGLAAIGAIADLAGILDGRAGTLIAPAGSLTYHPRRCAVALALR